LSNKVEERNRQIAFCRFLAGADDYLVNDVHGSHQSGLHAGRTFDPEVQIEIRLDEGEEHTMSNASIVKEALIASVTSAVVIPLLWLLGAAVNPERDVRSPGLDLVVLTLAGAALCMLLRSTWRNTALPTSDRDEALEDWNWRSAGDSYSGGHC